MTVPPLDHTSRRILQLLVADGRASYQAIADEVGLSRPAVMERVKRLEEAGFIGGYHARLDRSKCGLPVTAFVAIRYPVAEHAGDDPKIQALVAKTHLRECPHLAGADCDVGKGGAPTRESRGGVLREIKKPGHPVSTRTTIVLSTVFEKPGIAPVEAD